MHQTDQHPSFSKMASNSEQDAAGKSSQSAQTLTKKDRHPGKIDPDRLQELANNNFRSKQLKAYSEMANGNMLMAGKKQLSIIQASKTTESPVIQRIPIGQINTLDSADFSILENMNPIQLEHLYGKIKIAKKAGEDGNNQAWLDAIEQECMKYVARFKTLMSISASDQDTVRGISSATKSGKGVTKRVFLPDGSDKVYATPLSSNSVMGLLSEIIKLGRLAADGFIVPKTYLGGFDDHDDKGFPQINNPHAEASSAANAQSQKLPVFAMDRVEGNSYDLWKELLKFEKDFITDKKYNHEYSIEQREPLIRGMNKLLDYLQRHIIIDLQMVITENLRLTLLDPARIYDLADEDDHRFIKQYAEENLPIHENIKKKLTTALSILSRNESDQDDDAEADRNDPYLLTQVERNNSIFTTVLLLFDFLSEKCHGQKYSQNKDLLTENDLRQFAEKNAGSEFVDMNLSSTFNELITYLGRPSSELNISTPD